MMKEARKGGIPVPAPIAIPSWGESGSECVSECVSECESEEDVVASDEEVMRLTGISQSYYDVGALHLELSEGMSECVSEGVVLGSPLPERLFNETDLMPIERSIEQPTHSVTHSQPHSQSKSQSQSRVEKESALEQRGTGTGKAVSWWESSAVGVVVVLGALSVLALTTTRKK